jgi:DNA-binding NtrC family response regulator
MRIDQRNNEDFTPLPANGPADDQPLGGSLATQLEQVEKRAIETALKDFDGNKKRVARELNISRSYLYKKLADFGME